MQRRFYMMATTSSPPLHLASNYTATQVHRSNILPGSQAKRSENESESEEASTSSLLSYYTSNSRQQQCARLALVSQDSPQNKLGHVWDMRIERESLKVAQVEHMMPYIGKHALLIAV
jgi:hypothetical protein